MSDKDLLTQFNDNNKRARKKWSKGNVITPNPSNGIPTLISSNGINTPAIDPNSLSQGNDYASTTAANASISESIENDILVKVIDHFGTTNEPYHGPTFILPNGFYLDLSKASHHSDVEKYLIDNGLSNYEYLATGGSPTMMDLGCIRCDYEKYYIEVSDTPQPKRAQYDSLLIWLDMLSIDTSMVQVMCNNGKISKVYKFSDYISDEIVEKIKRYYSFGRLDEGLTGIRYPRHKVGESIVKVDCPNKYNPNIDKRSRVGESMILEASEEQIAIDIMKNNLNYCRIHSNDIFKNLQLVCEWDSSSNLIHILVQFKESILEDYVASDKLYPYPLDIIIPYDLPCVLIYNSKKSPSSPDMSTESTDEDSPFNYNFWTDENDDKTLSLILRDQLEDLDDALDRFNESLIESSNDLNDQFHLVDEKEVPDKDGNKSTYEWYMDSDQNSVFIYNDEINHEESEIDKAQEWWDSFTGFDESDLSDSLKSKISRFNELYRLLPYNPSNDIKKEYSSLYMNLQESLGVDKYDLLDESYLYEMIFNEEIYEPEALSRIMKRDLLNLDEIPKDKSSYLLDDGTVIIGNSNEVHIEILEKIKNNLPGYKITESDLLKAVSDAGIVRINDRMPLIELPAHKKISSAQRDKLIDYLSGLDIKRIKLSRYGEVEELVPIKDLLNGFDLYVESSLTNNLKESLRLGHDPRKIYPEARLTRSAKLESYAIIKTVAPFGAD